MLVEEAQGISLAVHEADQYNLAIVVIELKRIHIINSGVIYNQRYLVKSMWGHFYWDWAMDKLSQSEVYIVCPCPTLNVEMKFMQNNFSY